MKPDRARDAAALLLALLGVSAAAFIYYLLRAAPILTRAAGSAQPGDHVVFLGWTLAVLIGLALGAALVFGGLGGLGRALGALFCGTLLVGIYLDDRLHELLGVHLYGEAAIRALSARHANQVLHVTGSEAASILLGVAAGAVLTFVLTVTLRRRLARVERPAPALVLIGAIASAIAAAGLVAARPALGAGARLGQALPLHSILFRVAREEGLRIYYPKGEAKSPALERRPNVVLALVESLRADALTPELMPELSRFADEARCDRSQHHHAGSHVTDYSFFSVLYGLHAYQYLPFAQQRIPSFPLRVLRDNGYAIIGAASSDLESWGELKDVLHQFDHFEKIDGPGPAERDRAMLDWATKWQAEHGAERPYLLLLFFDATHHKYFYPPTFARHAPALPDDHNLVTGKVQDPAIRLGFVNRYRNAVGYVDSLLGTLLRTSSAADPNALLIAAGDHGEEFWDRGLLGHAAVHLVNARTEVPLVLCTPEHEGRRFSRSSNTDLMPTILDYARPRPRLDDRDYANGRSLLREEDPDRFLVVTGMGFPFTHRELQLISAQRKYTVEKRADGDKDFHVIGVTDLDDEPAPPVPGEAERGLAELRRSYRYFYRP